MKLFITLLLLTIFTITGCATTHTSKKSYNNFEQVFHIKVKNEKSFIVVSANDQELMKIEKKSFESDDKLSDERNKVLEQIYPYIWDEVTFNLTITCPQCEGYKPNFKEEK